MSKNINKKIANFNNSANKVNNKIIKQNKILTKNNKIKTTSKAIKTVGGKLPLVGSLLSLPEIADKTGKVFAKNETGTLTKTDKDELKGSLTKLIPVVGMWETADYIRTLTGGESTKESLDNAFNEYKNTITRLNKNWEERYNFSISQTKKGLKIEAQDYIDLEQIKNEQIITMKKLQTKMRIVGVVGSLDVIVQGKQEVYGKIYGDFSKALKDLESFSIAEFLLQAAVNEQDENIKKLNSNKDVYVDKYNKSKNNLVDFVNKNNTTALKIIENKKPASQVGKEILAKNKEKQEAKQKQENAKKLAEQTEEVAKLKKAVQTAENLREKNTKLAEQYANNPTTANKNALDKSGREFANARDDVSEYDNGEYAQTHKYENSFTVDKDRQVKQNFDTALGDMSQEQKDILARADYDSDDFAEGVIGREQAGRDYAQEQADFYALGGGEDKLKDEKDLASLEDFFDKLLKDDDLADVNDDEKTKVGDNENNNELRSIRGSFSYIGIHQNGGDTYSIGSLETRDNNNTFDSTEYLDFSNSKISGGYPAIAPPTTSEASPDVDGYKYTAWGDWSLSGLVADIGGQDYAVDYGHYVMGNATIDMPSFGNATYNGKLIGGTVGISNNGVVEKNSIGGTIEIGVNFNNSSLSAVLNSTKNNSNWAVARFSNISVQKGGHFHTGFNRTVDGGGVSRIDGQFFGTNAQEVGGSFQISKTRNDADNATGVFRAKR
jgi:hypothetical protein